MNRRIPTRPLVALIPFLAAAACSTNVGETSAQSGEAVATRAQAVPAPNFVYSAWSQIPGGGTTATPDAAVSYAGKLYVFGIGIGDHAHYMNSFDGLAWSGWSAIPGGGTTNVADTAVTFNGRLYLFGIGIGDHAHYVNSFDGTTWSGWSAVPGGGTTLVSDGAAVYDGKLYLFGIGTGDHAHYVKTFDGATWSGWSAIPGGGTTLLPDAAVSFNGRLYVFGIGIGDHGQYVNSFDGATWSGWSAVPGGLTSLAPDAAISYGGHLYLYGVGASDNVPRVNAFDGASWSGWSALPNRFTSTVAVSAAVYHDTIYTLGIGSDSHHYVQTVSTHAPLPPYNKVAFTATHNSYWVDRDAVYEIDASGTQERLVDQAVFEGARGMEIDLHHDDTTAHNFTVYHTNLETNSLCPQLGDCLKELVDFQHAVPDHDPFTLVLELKETTSEQMFDSTHTPADLDAIVEKYLGPYLFRPAELMTTCPGATTLRGCVRSAGWPSVDALRGKFLVSIIGNYDAGIDNDCFPVVVHDRKAWVDYAAQATQRSAFLMESPWATPWIACQEGISQTLVDNAQENAPFIQFEGGANGLAFPDELGWFAENLIVRADIGQNDQPQLADQQAAVTAAGVTLIQNDYPWWTTANVPLRLGLTSQPLADVNALNEPGHRILMKQLTTGGVGQVKVGYGTQSLHWETLVSNTRATTSSASPNPRRPYGTGCLYASSPSDANGSFQNGIRVCRSTMPAGQLNEPNQDASITVEIVTGGKLYPATWYSDVRDATGPGELLRLDVSQTATSNACATVYSSEQTATDVPVWRTLATQCFATTLPESGLAARDGDVLFAATKNAHASQASAPLVATDDFDVYDTIGTGFAAIDLTWPRVTPAPACTPDIDGGCAVGVHRADSATSGHFYSTDIREASSWGFNVEVPNYFYVEQAPGGTGRAAFNRCYNATANRRFYTQDPNCEGFGPIELVLGYVATTQLPGTEPLYRMYASGANDHFYTTDWNEVQSATKVGYAYEEIAGYVWSTAGLTSTGTIY